MEAREKLSSPRGEMRWPKLVMWGQKVVGRFWRYWKITLTKRLFCSPQRERCFLPGG